MLNVTGGMVILYLGATAITGPAQPTTLREVDRLLERARIVEELRQEEETPLVADPAVPTAPMGIDPVSYMPRRKIRVVRDR